MLTKTWLVLLLVLTTCAWAHDITLPVIKGEFVSLRIGYPFQTFTFMLRWDLDDIYLFSSFDLLDMSQTYTKDDDYHYTDLICLDQCIRLPIVTSYSPPENTDKRVETFAEGFDGALGLGSRSPIWSHFRWYEFNGKQLRLTDKNPIRREAFQSNVDGIFQGKLITHKERRDCNISVDLSSDFTEMPFRLQHSALRHQWTIKLYDAVDAEDKTHMTIMPEMTKAIDRRNVAVDTIRALHVRTNQTQVILGRLVLQQFVVARDVRTRQIWLASHAKDFSLYEGVDYEGLFIPLIIFLVLWVLGVYESADRFNRFEEARIPEHSKGRLRLHLKDAPGLGPIDVWSQYVFQEKLQTKEEKEFLSYIPVVSFRHHNFIPFFVLVTQVTTLFVLLIVLFGFGFELSFKHFEWSTEDRFALYSASSVALLCAMALSARLVLLVPTIGSFLASTALSLCIWILSSLYPFETTNTFLMLCSSAFVAIRWAEALHMVLTDSLYPVGVVKQRKWLWAGLILLLALWSAYLFSFYTVPFVIQQRNQSEIEAYMTGAASLIFIVLIGSVYMHIQERLAKSTLKAYTLSGMASHLADNHVEMDDEELEQFPLAL